MTQETQEFVSTQGSYQRLASAVTQQSNYYIDGFNVAGTLASRVRQNGLFKAVAQYNSYEIAQRGFIVATTLACLYAAQKQDSLTGLWGVSVKTAITCTAIVVSHAIVMLETLHRRSKLHEKISVKQKLCEKYSLACKDMQGFDILTALLDGLKKHEPVLRRKGDMLAFLDKKHRLYEFIASVFIKNEQEPSAGMQTVLEHYERCNQDIGRLFDEVATLGITVAVTGLNRSY